MTEDDLHEMQFATLNGTRDLRSDKVLDFINAKWIRQYCKVEINSNTERWEKFGRPKNDSYINGSHSGYVHALQDLLNLIDRIERIELRQQER